MLCDLYSSKLFKPYGLHSQNMIQKGEEEGQLQLKLTVDRKGNLGCNIPGDRNFLNQFSASKKYGVEKIPTSSKGSGVQPLAYEAPSGSRNFVPGGAIPVLLADSLLPNLWTRREQLENRWHGPAL